MRRTNGLMAVVPGKPTGRPNPLSQRSLSASHHHAAIASQLRIPSLTPSQLIIAVSIPAYIPVNALLNPPARRHEFSFAAFEAMQDCRATRRRTQW
jgi:hypothetical protein